MTQSANPLKAFFRQPAIYLKLPSNGAYWPEDAIEFPTNRELPVYPMTAVDEITYRTPDALFSGQSVVNVIESCIPNIKNAWSAPFVDVNSILIVENNQPVGIVTDEDIVRKCVAAGLDSRKLKVKDVASTDIITITPDKDVYDALSLMREHNIRQLPVFDKELLGFLTVRL